MGAISPPRTPLSAFSGTGSAVVNAAQTLDVTIGGTGTISYLGSPTVTKDISGVGSVVAAKE